jgi:succinate dehydrogenase / fumarate reductase, cytochrome b subunit
MTERPISPHLTIYKLPMAALISIIHRGVGVVVYLFLILFAVYFLLLAHGGASYLDPFLRSWLGVMKLTGMMIILYFYLFGEIRYIIWSLNKGFSPTFIRWSNWVILGMTALMGFALILKIKEII